MKLLVALLLIPFFCFAQQQGVTGKIHYIDSIAKSNGASIEASGLIKKKRFLFGKKVIGGFSQIIYLDSPIKKERSIIKAIYGENIIIKKNYLENIFAEFYYNNNTLFFVRIKKIKDKKGTESASLYEIDFEKEIDPKINEELGFNVKEWIENLDLSFKEMQSISK